MNDPVTLLPNVAVNGRKIRGCQIGKDGYYLEDVVTSPVAHETIPFEDRDNPALAYRSHKLPRSKSFFYDPALRDQGLVPIYRYPGWQWGTLALQCPWNQYPVIQDLNNVLSSITIDGEPLPPVNHCICTLYKNGKDNISPHNDKVATIEGNIYTFTFGSPRELHFHWNDNKDLRNPDIVLVPQRGSLVILGPLTNLAMKHSIPTTEYNKVLPKDTGPRVSVIFRSATRLLTTEQVDKAVARSEKSKETRNKRKRDSARD